MKNMKKINLILSVLLMFSGMLYSQQDIQATQYMYHMNVLNPAYAGARETLSINFLGRTQWVGIDGAPETATFSIHAPFKKNVGLGLSVVYDQLGPVKESNIFVDFSYTIDVTDFSKLAFGVKGGVTSHVINRDLLFTLDPDDQLLINAGENKLSPNFGVGVFYYTSKYYIGLSVPNILKSKYYKDKKGYVSNANETAHYFLTSGYVFEISESLDLKPSVMVKATFGAPVSIDLSVNALIYSKLEFGLSYRLDDSVSAMVGFNISPDVRLGYAYDYTLSDLGNYNSGSHEIMLLFDVRRMEVRSPRFF